MIEATARTRPEPQQELRFSANGEFYEALKTLDERSRRPSDDTEREIGVTAIKRILIDPSDKYERDDHREYSDGINGFAENGYRGFALADYMDLKYFSQDKNNGLFALGFRLLLPNEDEQRIILRPPFLGPRRSYDTATNRSAEHTLQTAKRAGFLPVKFELRHTLFNYDDAVARVERALKVGVMVTNMHLAVPGRRERLHTVS